MSACLFDVYFLLLFSNPNGNQSNTCTNQIIVHKSFHCKIVSVFSSCKSFFPLTHSVFIAHLSLVWYVGVYTKEFNFRCASVSNAVFGFEIEMNMDWLFFFNVRSMCVCFRLLLVVVFLVQSNMHVTTSWDHDEDCKPMVELDKIILPFSNRTKSSAFRPYETVVCTRSSSFYFVSVWFRFTHTHILLLFSGTDWRHCRCRVVCVCVSANLNTEIRLSVCV